MQPLASRLFPLALAAGLLPGLFPAGAAAEFQLRDLPGERLELRENGCPVLVFNYGLQLREGVKEQYRRADYFHPIYDPDGVALTDDFPKDHLHHRGLFWAWPEVTVEGQTCDPWGCVGLQQRFRRWLARETGAEGAVLQVENGWYLGDRSVVREIVAARIHPLAGAGRAMDVSLTLEAEQEPVSLRGRSDGKKGYGGFTLRLAPRRDASVCTPEGRLAEDGVQVRAPWADYSGKFGAGEGVSGVAILDHPANPSHPTTWLLRYYGVLNPTWPALETVTLEPGKPVTLRYRIWIHRGDAASARIEEAWKAWVKTSG